MSSWFSGTAAAPSTSTTTLPPLGQGQLHPVSKRYTADKLFGALQPEVRSLAGRRKLLSRSCADRWGREQDTEWLAQQTGFVAETQVFYATLPGGKLLMAQVIHSGIG